MKIRITNLSVELDDERNFHEIISSRLKISQKKIISIKIIRKAVDARRYKNSKIKFNFVVDVEIDGNFIFRDKIFR